MAVLDHQNEGSTPEAHVREQDLKAQVAGWSLRDREARYRALVEGNAQTLWVTGVTGEVVEDSQSWRLFTGQSPEDWLGLGWLDAIHEGDRTTVEQRWREALAGREAMVIEFRLQHVSGGHRWVTLRAVPLLDQGDSVRGWVGMTVDIEERKRTELDLLRSEQRFRAVFEAAPVASAITDADDTLLDVNGTFESLVGYTQAEVIGCSAKSLGFWSSPHDQENLRAALEGRQALRGLDMQVRTKQGAVLDVFMSIAHVALGTRSGYVKMMLDVTERRRNERELAEAIQAAMQDTRWLVAGVLERLARHRSGAPAEPELSVLTPREREVLDLLAQGKSYNTISDELGLARSTVRNYVAVIYGKLGVDTRPEAVVWARQRGLGGD